MSARLRHIPARVPLLLRLSAFIRLVHAFPIAVVMVTAMLLLIVAHRGAPPAGFLARALAVVLLTQVPVGALNDLVDREDDRVHQPSKPIPSGLVSPREALAVVILSLAGLIALSLTFGRAAALLIWFAAFGGLAYDLWLKPTPFSVVGYMIGFLGLTSWLWLIAGHFTPAFALVVPAGALILLAGHLAQSFPDIESDRAIGARGLAATLGSTWTARLIVLAYLTAIAGALVICVASEEWLALALCGLPAVLLPPVLAMASAPESRAKRVRLFHLAAPGLGMLAVIYLLVISRVS